MIYASETWALTGGDERRLERAEMRMLRWIAGVKLSDRKHNEEVRRMLDVEPIVNIVRRKRLQWFGHVVRMNDEDGVKKAFKLKVEGKRDRGRPRTSWIKVVEADMIAKGVKREMAYERTMWRSAIR